MAETKPLKADATGLAQFGSTDTFPATSLPARLTISPSQLTGDQDNYNPTDWATADVVRLNFDTGGRAITGLTAWTNGRQKVLLNTTANFGYIACEHPDSNAANRVLGVCDHIIAPYGTLLIEYDATSSRTRVIGNSFSVSSPGVGNLRGHYYNLPVGSVTAADWGDFGFAGSSLAATAGTAALPGGWTIGTASSASGATSIYAAKNVLNPSFFGSAHMVFSTSVYFPTLSDGTQTYTFSFGLVPSPSSTTLAVNNSVCIRYSSGVNSGKFEGFCRDNAGTESTVDLGTTVAANTLYALTVCFDKARSEARFYVDGVMAGRVAANVPNAVATGGRAVIVKSAGTTARTAIMPTINFCSIY